MKPFLPLLLTAFALVAPARADELEKNFAGPVGRAASTNVLGGAIRHVWVGDERNREFGQKFIRIKVECTGNRK